MMTQTLEAFAKKNRIRVFARQIVERRFVSSRQTMRQHNRTERWAYEVFPPFVMQTFSYRRRKALPGIDNSVGGTLLPAYGATRKEARDKFVAKIRGTTLISGSNHDFRVRVPNNLR